MSYKPIHNFRKDLVTSVLFVDIISSCYFTVFTLFYTFCCCFSANLGSRFTSLPFVLIRCIACYKHTRMSKMHRTTTLFTCSVFGLFLGLSALLQIIWLSLSWRLLSCCLLLDVLLARKSLLHLFFIFIIFGTLTLAYDLDHTLHLTGSFLTTFQLSLLF